jgi:hypothetical protein
MPTTLNPTCPLCGLRYTGRPLLDLHIREDHRRRDDHPEPDPGDPGDSSDAGTSLPRARGLFPLHSLAAGLYPATREVTAAPAVRRSRRLRLGWASTALHRVAGALRYTDQQMMRAFEALARERRVNGRGRHGVASRGRA